MVAQVTAVIIFLVMFALIITDKIERQYVTLGCGLATLVLVFGVFMQDMNAAMETLNIRAIFTPDFWYEAGNASESSSGINWATIIFIAGMMGHGRRHGKGGILPLVMYDNCKTWYITEPFPFLSHL